MTTLAFIGLGVLAFVVVVGAALLVICALIASKWEPPEG